MRSLTRTSRSRPRREGAGVGPQRVPVRVAELLDVLAVVREAVHPLVEPGVERLLVLRDAIPLQVEAVVAVVVALGERRDGRRTAPRPRRRPPRPGSPCGWGRGGSTGSSTTSSTTTITLLGGERDLLLAAQQPPDLRVAVGIGALRVHDRDVGPQRRHHVDLVGRRRRARPSARSSGSPSGCRSRSSCGSGRRAGSPRRPCSGRPCRSASTPRSRAARGRPSRCAGAPRAGCRPRGCPSS